MHPDLVYASLFCCSRNDLEYLQPISRSLLNMIAKGSKALPLRPTHRVHMDFSVASEDEIKIYVGDAVDTVDTTPDYKAPLCWNYGVDFTKTFRHLQNTCIKCFSVGIRDSAFLRHWKRRRNAAFTVVSINFDLTETQDYDLLDSVVNHLRPRTSGFSVDDTSSGGSYDPHNNEGLELIIRGSFLANLQTCTLYADTSFPPPALFFKEPGYTNYKLWCYHANVASGIDALIETFIRDGCANTKLESVSILWEDGDGQQPAAPKKLSEPTETDEPFPDIDLKWSWIRVDHRVSACEMHVFANTKKWQRMEVYKWTLEYISGDSPRTTQVLQCRVKDF